MTMMSDLSQDLIEEILFRVLITSLGAVRSTCKRWNFLSKDRVLCKAEAKHQFLGFIMMKKFKVFSMRFNLNEDVDKFVVPSIKKIGNLLDQVEISNVIHSEGLLLCVIRHNTGLMVWNPYLNLGQIRKIEPSNTYHLLDMYALGYDHNKNRNHKILRMFNDYDSYACKLICNGYEIYDFMSNSWRNIDVAPHGHTLSYAPTVSLKGNTYFVAIGSKIGEEVMGIKYCLLCFDFTSEKFGPHLPLPSHGDRVAISSVREEQLAVLYEPRDTSKMEIWVTTKIEPNAVSWSYFLKVDVTDFKFDAMVRSFFIDQEKTLAVFFMDDYKNMITSKCIAAFIGENGYLRKVYLGQALKLKDGPYAHPLVYSYVPSLVQA